MKFLGKPLVLDAQEAFSSMLFACCKHVILALLNWFSSGAVTT